MADALCVDVEGCAPAELPWATLLGVMRESGHSHPRGLPPGEQEGELFPGCLPRPYAPHAVSKWGAGQRGWGLPRLSW